MDINNEIESMMNDIKLMKDDTMSKEKYLVLAKMGNTLSSIKAYDNSNEAIEYYDGIADKEFYKVVKADVTYILIDGLELIDHYKIIEVVCW